MDIISDKWRNRWNSDEVRVLVLASLGMQIGLIFLAPLRKRNKNPVLMLTLWLLYLTADNVAILALGNISNLADPAESGDSGTKPGKLTILWAPFLLLHLGGPDSITSYSIEDNELWWRHLLGLVVQVVITVYVFLRSPPLQLLWIPTILVFLPGLIKFAERTHALRLGSKDNLKDKIISEISPAIDIDTAEILSKSIKNGRGEGEEDNDQLLAIETESISENGAGPANESKAELSERDESQDICEGYVWFNIFKRLLVDVTFPSNLLMQSQDRFSGMSAREALNLVAIELSFLYDILHTKAVHMHYNFNRVLRCSTLFSIIAALIVFDILDKQKYASKDIIITYILFSAGLTIEVVTALLLVSSDWTVVSLRKKEWRKCIARAITKMVKRITFMKGKSRWSKTIGQFNLVSLCLRDRDTLSAKFMRIIKIKRIWDNMWESDSISLPESLQEIMFTEAKRRAAHVHIYNVLVEARSYRGNKTLERHKQLETLEWSMKREFDESIILWHVATDICYYEDTSKSNQRDVSWNTSNYMIYLLTQQQSMMQLGYGKTRFEATCSVVKKKLKKFKGDRKRNYKQLHDTLEKDEGAALLPEQTNTPVSDDGREHGWRCWGKCKDKEDERKNEGAAPVPEQNEGATQVPEQTNTPVSDDGREHGWRCWGKRKDKEDERKNEGAAPVPEQNEGAAQVPEQTNTPVSDDGHQHGWRFWGKRKHTEDKRKNEGAAAVLEQNEGAAQVREQTNTPVSDDGREHGWRFWGKRKHTEDKCKNEGAAAVVEQNEGAAQVREQTNTPVSDEGSQHGWRCWGKRKHKNEGAAAVLEQNEGAAQVREQTNTPVSDDGSEHGWRCWGKSKSKNEKQKLRDQEEMGKLVIKEGIRLAKELQEIKPETKKWELISETWMEMLGYAAIHCDSYQHARSLSRGGELLTHLWLLMSQLGVVEEHKMQQFQSGSV